MARSKYLMSLFIPLILLVVLVASITFWRVSTSSERQSSASLREFDFLAQVKGPPGHLTMVGTSQGEFRYVDLACPFDGDGIIDAIKIAKGSSRGPVRSDLYGEMTTSATMINFASLAEHFGLDYQLTEINRRLQLSESGESGSHLIANLNSFTSNTVPDRLDNWSGTVYRVRSVNIATCNVVYEKFKWPVQDAVSITKADLQKFGYFVLRPNSELVD